MVGLYFLLCGIGLVAVDLIRFNLIVLLFIYLVVIYFGSFA